MSKGRISAKDKLKAQTQKDLFAPTAYETTGQISLPNTKDSTSDSIPQKHKDIKSTSKLKRQTYYLEPDMIRALGLKSVLEGRDKSDIVRAALAEYIERRFFEIDWLYIYL